MIWGLTRDEEWARRQTWRQWFAWRPVQLIDGRWAWLQVVEWRYYGGWDGLDSQYRELLSTSIKRSNNVDCES